MHRIHGAGESTRGRGAHAGLRNAVNAGRERRRHTIGAIFYLRSGDESKATSGLPSTPASFPGVPRPKPLEGTVGRVVQTETKRRGPIVVIKRGSNAGLRTGMTLVAVNPRRPHFRADLTILSLQPDSAKAEVDFQYNHIRVASLEDHSIRAGPQQTRCI